MYKIKYFCNAYIRNRLIQNLFNLNRCNTNIKSCMQTYLYSLKAWVAIVEAKIIITLVLVSKLAITYYFIESKVVKHFNQFRISFLQCRLYDLDTIPHDF